MIQRNTRTTSGSGQRTDSWGELCKRWAEVNPVTGGEKFRGHQLQAETSWVLFLPCDTQTRSVTSKDRILWKGKTLAILSAWDVESAGVEIMVQCKETP